MNPNQGGPLLLHAELNKSVGAEWTGALRNENIYRQSRLLSEEVTAPSVNRGNAADMNYMF